MSIDAHKFCVAPMMDWTDRHCRYFLRLISKRALLYTEMVTTGALLHGDKSRFLDFDAAEQPLALQLGGSNPQELAACSKFGEEAGYQEINLNVGCPSDRVQNHKIGACLMAEPNLVGDCIKAMQDKVSIPVTVKCRTGIDELDSWDYLKHFIETVVQLSDCPTFIIHARIALLQGLSPKQNREIPPLNYPRVYQAKEYFPELEIIINGGVRTIEDSAEHLQHCDGVMIGREAYQNPWLLHAVDSKLFADEDACISRTDIMEKFYPYVEQQLQQGAKLNHLTRHVLGLFQGEPGGKRFRRYISENSHRPDADLSVLHTAVALVSNKAALEEAS